MYTRWMFVMQIYSFVWFIQVMETSNMVYIVSEYAENGEVFGECLISSFKKIPWNDSHSTSFSSAFRRTEYIAKKGRLSEDEAHAKFTQILDAVDYCHRNYVVHRDLKVSVVNFIVNSFEFCWFLNSLILPSNDLNFQAISFAIAGRKSAARLGNEHKDCRWVWMNINTNRANLLCTFEYIIIIMNGRKCKLMRDLVMSFLGQMNWNFGSVTSWLFFTSYISLLVEMDFSNCSERPSILN